MITKSVTYILTRWKKNLENVLILKVCLHHPPSSSKKIFQVYSTVSCHRGQYLHKQEHAYSLGQSGRNFCVLNYMHQTLVLSTMQQESFSRRVTYCCTVQKMKCDNPKPSLSALPSSHITMQY